MNNFFRIDLAPFVSRGAMQDQFDWQKLDNFYTPTTSSKNADAMTDNTKSASLPSGLINVLLGILFFDRSRY